MSHIYFQEKETVYILIIYEKLDFHQTFCFLTSIISTIFTSCEIL